MELKDVESMFEKKFTFKKHDWILPSVSNWCVENIWTINELAMLKLELNATKSILNDKDIREWRRHTSYTNKAGTVLSTVKKKIKPEFLTQAWCKFYEILNSYGLVAVTSDSKRLRTLHLCEAPGAFIAALNHFLCSNFSGCVEWNWIANTLNPYYEETPCQNVIVDDRLLLPTLEKWHFGSDNTGNIMDASYLDSLVTTLESRGKRHLVTADGSIDCQDFPEEQESTVSQLHLAEAITGFFSLLPGGSFVIKMFTFYECMSICLMYLLNTLFGEVHVFKPATSKSGNSEVYVICLNFQGCDLTLMEILKNSVFCLPSNKALFRLKDMPDSFLQQLIVCNKLFKNYQEETIRRNVELYEKMNAIEMAMIDIMKEECSSLFLTKYRLRPIKTSQKLLYGSNVTSQLLAWALQDNKGTKGSLNDRRKENCKPWKEQLLALEYQVYEFACHKHTGHHSNVNTDFIRQSLSANEMDFTKWLTMGQPLSEVRSSKFCPILLITWWNKLVKNAKMLKARPQNHAHWHDESYNYLRSIEFCENSTIYFLCPEATGKVSVHVVEDLSIPLDASTEIKCVPLSETIIAEIQRKEQFLHSCIHALSICQRGDTVVLRIMTVLTRFTVGVLYLLSACFSSVRVIPFEEEGKPSYWWLEGYLAEDFIIDIKNYLKKICTNLQNEDKSGKTVLQIVPIQLLCQEPFYSFVYEQNTNYMMKILLYFIFREKEFLKK